MVKRGMYPFHSFWNEIDEMMAEMEERLTQRLSGGYNYPVTQRFLPALTSEFRIDVLDHDDEAIVVADLPGVKREDIKAKLVDSKTLEISCEKEEQTEEENKDSGYYMRERNYGTMKRLVSLPVDVTEDGSTGTFKNGVLEIHLKKLSVSSSKGIEIQ
ncbi:Hsp20/alpha crystallin family protein [Methanoplanus sp. FWC-SCC4]|uniref:Hsp20/alpha crystallin family protein n=1 Tax=Methanochimaera problematica TaxID=2609417 RepID=A0AA97I2M9_9EURY|nr:Hsp20/alpha crystallin family protein [Methanoplanus sp. FWC-SCC4]WOF15778.1 Hsp20/alpha crystallin family protein [Methanoplanus sp. FWC-SCC4]